MPFEITTPIEERIARWRRVRVLGTPKDKTVTLDDGTTHQGEGLSLAKITVQLEEEGFEPVSRERVRQLLAREDPPREPGDSDRIRAQVAGAKPKEPTTRKRKVRA